jgi:L-rhamnose mutarotase
MTIHRSKYFLIFRTLKEDAMKRYCLALDLKNDPSLISEYEEWHRKVWPEIEKSILDSGIINLEIYRVDERMFMIMEADDSFTFEQKAAMDAANPKVQEWEMLMWRFQQAIPSSRPGEKWRVMEKIYDLKKS